MTTCAEKLRIKGRPGKVQSDTHSGHGSLGKLSPPCSRQPIMILLYAASRDPRRGESPVMCARTVQVAAPPGEVVSNTGKQNRKVLAAPVMGASASVAGATTLLRQKHGNCLYPSTFLHSFFLSFVRWPRYSLLPFPSSDGSHACAAEMVRYREERNYEP